MKTSITLLALLQIAIAAASADTVLVQETQLNGVASRTTMSIRGPMIRTDSGTGSSVIINTASGEMTTLMHEQKMVVRVDTRALAAAAAAPVPGGEAAAKPTASRTGQKEKVDGHDCEIWEMTNAGTTIRAWVATDYPGYDKLKEELKVMQKMSAPGAQTPPELPGMMVKSEYEQNGLKFTTRLISLSSEPVSEKLFTVPADYKAPGA